MLRGEAANTLSCLRQIADGNHMFAEHAIKAVFVAAG